MSRVFNGSSQYLSVLSTLLSNEPIGMFAWANSNSIANSQDVISLGDGSLASGAYVLRFAGATAGDPIQAIKNDDAGTGAVIASSATGYSASTWTAGGANFGSDTSRDAYINGGGKGSNTTSRADPTPNYITIGALRRSTVVGYFDGSIAEAFIFDAIPTDAQHALLAKGVHPIEAAIVLSNIRGWYPLMGDDNNRMAGGYPNLSPTASPTFGSHPSNPIYPRIGGLLFL